MSDYLTTLPVGQRVESSGRVDGISYKIDALKLSRTSLQYTISPYVAFIDGEWQVVLESATQTIPYGVDHRGSSVTMGPCSEKHLHQPWRWSEKSHPDWMKRIMAVIEDPDFAWAQIFDDRGSYYYEGAQDPYVRMLVAKKSGRKLVGFLILNELPFTDGDEISLPTLLQIRMVAEAGQGSSDPSPAGTKQIAYAGIASPNRPIIRT